MSNNAETTSHELIGKCQTIASVLWPSFFVAGVANSIFWIFVDPHDFGLITGYPELTRIGAYSIGFIAIWVTLAISSFLTQVFSKPCPKPSKKNVQ